MQNEQSVSMEALVKVLMSLYGLGKDIHFKDRFTWEKSYRIIS
jgi:hypothetical protein